MVFSVWSLLCGLQGVLFGGLGNEWFELVQKIHQLQTFAQCQDLTFMLRGLKDSDKKSSTCVHSPFHCYRNSLHLNVIFLLTCHSVSAVSPHNEECVMLFSNGISTFSFHIRDIRVLQDPWILHLLINIVCCDSICQRPCYCWYYWCVDDVWHFAEQHNSSVGRKKIFGRPVRKWIGWCVLFFKVNIFSDPSAFPYPKCKKVNFTISLYDRFQDATGKV